MSFFLGALIGPLPHEPHKELFEVPGTVLHLILILHVVLTCSGFSLLSLQHKHVLTFPCTILNDCNVILTSCVSGITDCLPFTTPVIFIPIFVKW